jgi:hypothetical protein
MKRLLVCAAFFFVAVSAHAQIQVDLKFKRLHGSVAVGGGMLDVPVAPAVPGQATPKLSDRPADLPPED